MKKIFPLILLLIFVISCAKNQIPQYDFDIERNITYCIMDDTEIKMDIYQPLGADIPLPAVLYIHGGSWSGGDKNSPATAPDRAALAQAGFLVASVNYRLAPEYQFPAMIEDVKCAVRYLRAHAQQYNLDTNRIGAWGNSAGGHLALLLAFTDSSAGWDVGQHLEYSSAVQAVANFYAPTDIAAFFPNNNERVFGNEDFRAANPLSHIKSDAPPVIIFHGDMDTLVPLKQSQDLYNALTSNNVNAELIEVKNGGHGFTPQDSPNMTPSREQVTQMLVDFFIKVLK